MKKIYLLLLMLPFILQSCLMDDNSVFAESAVERMDATLKHHQEVLMGAKNGWMMEYFPHNKQSFGGYTMLVKFGEKNEVTVASERGGANKTESSLYQLIGDNGPVLTLNTHNSLFHYFSEPKNPDGIGPDDSGMGGDYEFLILESTPEKVTMKGKKTGNRIVMTPISKETNWSNLMAEYLEAGKRMAFSAYKFTIKDISASISISYRTLTFTYPGENEAIETQTVAYRITSTGFVFYEPLEIGGVEIKELVYKNENNTEFFIDPNGSDARLTAIIPPLTQQLLKGNWYFAYSKLGGFGPGYWNTTKNALAAIGEELYDAYLGVQDGNYGFCFRSTDGKGLYKGVLFFTTKVINDEEIEYTFASKGANDGVWYYTNAKFINILHPISSGTARTFTLTCDDIKNPEWIELQDKSIQNNTIRLSKTPITYPFSN